MFSFYQQPARNWAEQHLHAEISFYYRTRMNTRHDTHASTCMFSFWITADVSENSWSGGSLSGSGFSTVKANSNFATNNKKDGRTSNAAESIVML